MLIPHLEISSTRHGYIGIRARPTPLPSPPKKPPSKPSKEFPDLLDWITTVAAIVSAIGAITTALIAWRADRRLAKEQALRIAQLERELKVAKRR